MSEFVTDPNLADPDGFYADLLAAHEGLSEEESAAFNARLILVLANQIGAPETLRAALAAAAEAGARG
ncbi:DUF2783 domain-containing protein [Roseivivax sp. GX 12232]|uniref:DUF2783 domain-containing protein n=1 Tax=Roseivivax sp. GX 12232 TaxID=2900547 RepID=UPI001E297967|nr:DUF2783 domain-containing protein [Roseivivax sp. GX 12232]MCE0505057.1 DUF2783 domain-containing protein [Roseivivax sp. GX 12232]